VPEAPFVVGTTCAGLRGVGMNHARKKVRCGAPRLAALLAATFACLSSLGAAARRTAAVPPSSLQPKAKTAPVRVSHRHRSIVQCARAPQGASCVGRVSDADTAAVVRFERSDVVATALNPTSGAVRVSFPHRAGPQEQTLDLPVGEWVVDWLGSERIERINVHPETPLHVALASTSGACKLKVDHCELLPGVRERYIRVSEGR
jgi:hypothetical protein